MQRHSFVCCATALIFIAAMQQAVQADEPRGLLIEAEQFDGRVPDDGSFAVPTAEPEASKRRVLFKFYVDGYALYRFTLPEEGTYRGWLRYGAKSEIRLRAALDPVGEPEFETVLIPATGGYIGPGVWGWARIFTRRLAAGDHTLAVGSAPLRPDCIYLTAGDEEPTDDLIHTDWLKMLDARTLELVTRPLTQVRPDWLDGATEYQLPEWYGRHRVHAHTRLSPRWFDKEIFLNAAQPFREMGVRTFVRHIKTGSEGAWWPSEVGAIHPALEGRNLAQEIIENAHQAGCRIIVYHRHIEDAYLAETQPDWMCRDAEGNPYKKRGLKICFNSPYADFVQRRLLELVDMGADAFYFDEVHMPRDGCWCEYCKHKFKQETGLDHPPYPDPGNPVWQKLKDFNNLTIERTFVKWRRAIHERNPEVVMLVGSNTWPTISDRHMTNRLFRIADSMKTEFSLPARTPRSLLFPLDPEMMPTEREVKIALGHTLARDACDGRPAHIWTHGLLDEASTLCATAGMVTHGCIANLDIRESTIPDMMFERAFALGDRVSPYLAGTQPVRWAALHYSEHARDRYTLEPKQAWRHVLYPFYGAYLALFRARLPVGAITDSQLEEGLLDGYCVLFLPTPDHLTERMRAAVEDFRAGGGKVIGQQEGWQWHDPEGGQDQAVEAFMEALGPEADQAPVQVFGGPEKMHAVAFADRTGDCLTVSLTNEFTWVFTGRKPDPDKLAELTQTPPPCTGVKVTIRGRGAPKRVFNAVSGKALVAEARPDAVEIAVPEFHHMAVLVAEF